MHTHMCCLLLLFVCVEGVCADPDEVQSVTEGDSVSLNSDIKDIRTDDHILWMFGPQETRITEIHRQKIYIYDSNTIFEKRLQMDSQTGSLTIRNIRSEHTGLYKLQIIRGGGTSYKRFNLNVYAPLPLPVITSNCSSSSRSSSSSSSSRCSVLCSAVNVSGVTLSWWKGISLLSSISVSDLSISLSLPLEVEYQDSNTYSCVLNNPITNHTTHLDNIRDLCQPCAESDPSYLHSESVIPSLMYAVLGMSAVALLVYHVRSRQFHKHTSPLAQSELK